MISKYVSLKDFRFRSPQYECLFIDDDYRLLIAVMSCSLMRLSEVAGLLVSDVKLVDDVMTLAVSSNWVDVVRTVGA